jgi:feruloyl-CoA synthase
MAAASAARVRTSRILAPDTVVRLDDRGRWRAFSPHPLPSYPDTLTDRLAQWAAEAPDRTFLAVRQDDGAWRRLTYAAAHESMRRVAQALLDRGLSADRPVVILSGNGIEHALVALAAMHVGIPYAPVAPSYSLVSRDYRTLGLVVSAMEPGLVFADNGPAFAGAIASLEDTSAVHIVTCHPSNAFHATPFDELVSTVATSAVDEAHRRVGPDSVAKVLFTSGSVGAPKGVINTQGMLCANQEQIRTVMAFLADEPPVLCDWLPWNHTFGGNHNFGLTLYNGGTLYIDAGTPTAAAFATTLTNLSEIATTAYFNVPRGFELLLPALESDPALSRVFFSRLQMLFYAAAGLRQEIVDAFERVAVDACGERIPWVTGLGSTETAPFAMCTGPMPEPVAGRIGVPVPGVELKVEPVGALLFEARVRGPNVTPGYWRDDALTSAAFDEDGFYGMGDAIEPVDPADLTRGFLFRGRIAEDFKLATGTWVRVGPLRAALLAHFGDLIQDVVIAGPDRADIRLLVFPNLATWRRLSGAPADAATRKCLEHPATLERFSTALAAFAATRTGSSTRVEHAILLEQPPSLDAAEITDKGSINQKAVLQHRRFLVDQLYGAPGPGLLVDVSRRSVDA